jgi:hydroxymethylglutaryl-CoA reductase (NADPH)
VGLRFELAESDHLRVTGRSLNPEFSEQPPRVPGGAVISPEALARRWGILGTPADCRTQLLDSQTAGQMEAYRHNIENFIGTVKLPVGLAGPLRVNGMFAKGDYYVPLATTEAALVASYSRGARLITEAGGAGALLLNEGVSRAPAFVFATFQDAGRFLAWLLTHEEDLRAAAQATPRHGKLVDIHIRAPPSAPTSCRHEFMPGRG